MTEGRVVLAVVGSVKFANPLGLQCAESLIRKAYTKLQPALVVSGGADGVDSLSIEIAKELGIEWQEFLPKNKRWAPEGFQQRNLLIARACTHLLRIHCEASTTYGSGWTANQAELRGAYVSRHMIPRSF